MNKLSIIASAALALSTATATANILGPDMAAVLNVTNLAMSCSFGTPMSGAMEYDEPSGKFVTLGSTAATMDITYRSLGSITVTNDAVFDGKAGAITAIDYTGSTFGETAITDNGDLTGVFTLVPDGALTIDTLTIQPTSISVAVANIDDLGAYPIAYTITCVE